MYQPSSRNANPDALSRLFLPDSSRSEPSFILSPFCVLITGSWKVQSRVLEARLTAPAPGKRPPNHLFVPDSVCQDVLQWGIPLR